MAGTGKAAMVLLVVSAAIVVALAQGGELEDPSICYCPCMKDQCMTIDRKESPVGEQEEQMAGTGKAAMVLLVVSAAIVVALAQGGELEDPSICYCPCMTIDGVSKEECARACDRGCREAGFPGQPNAFEFCGF